MKIPFSVETYKQHPEYKVFIKEGKPVRILCTDRKYDFPVVGLILNGEQDEMLCWSTEGSCNLDGSDSVYNLMMEVPTPEYWAVIKSDGRMISAYDSRESAQQAFDTYMRINPDRTDIKLVKLKVVEDE